jgi:4-amino-4-deoxy-L-arabinose transferase-like glycosyltransferase
VGAFLRWHGIGSRCLWADEITQVVSYLDRDLAHCVYNGAVAQTQTPLDYILGYGLLKVFPFSETIVRVPAMIFGTLLIPLMYLLVRELAPASVALAACLPVVFSPSLVQYSQEARPYSIYFFFLLLALRGWIKALREPSRSGLRWLFVCWSLLYFSRMMAPLVHCAALALCTGVMLKIASDERPRVFVPESARKTCLWAGGAIALQLPITAGILFLQRRYLGANDIGQAANLRFWTLPLRALFVHIYPQLYGFAYPAVAILLALAATGALLRPRRNPLLLWLLLFVLIDPIAHAYAFLVGVHTPHEEPEPRYFVYTQLLVIPVIAGGIHALAARRRKDAPIIAGLACGLLAALFALQLPRYYRSDEKPNYRAAGRLIDEEFVEGRDLILYVPAPQNPGWVPPLHGEGIYFRKKAEQLPLEEIRGAAWQRHALRGRIFLVIHEEPAARGKVAAGLVQDHFNGITVVRNARPLPFLEALQRTQDELRSRYGRDPLRSQMTPSGRS